MILRALRILPLAASLAAAGPFDPILPRADAPREEGRDPAAPPAFLRPGLRITYRTSDSQSAGKRLVPRTNGPIRAPDGSRYVEVDAQGGGGVGYTQINVMHAAADRLLADTTFYLFVDARQTPKYAWDGAIEGDGRSLDTYWLHPRALQGLETGEDLIVRRERRAFDGVEFDTVTLRYLLGEFLCIRVHDARSGLLLEGGTRTRRPGYTLRNDDGTTLDREEGESRSYARLLSLREVRLPWSAAKVPEWARPGLLLSYRGAYRDVIETFGLPPPPARPVDVAVEIERVEGGTALARFLATVGDPLGVTPYRNEARRAYGSSMAFGLWIDPASLGAIEAGRVLDEDPHVGSRLRFEGVAGGVAGFTLAAPLETREFAFDAGNGMLAFVRNTFRNPDRSTAAVAEYRLAAAR